MSIINLAEKEIADIVSSEAYLLATQYPSAEGTEDTKEVIRRIAVTKIAEKIFECLNSTSGFLSMDNLRNMYPNLIKNVGTNEEQTALIFQFWDDTTQEYTIQTETGLKFKSGRVDESGFLHLIDEDGNDIDGFEPFFVGNGGGGSSASSTILLSRIGSKTISVASGYECVLRFKATSTIEGESTGDMTLDLSVDGVHQLSKEISQGENSIEVSNLLKTGTHSVNIVVTDSYGNYRSLTYTVNVIELIIESTFDTSSVFTDGFIVKYSVMGSGDKTVHFVLDGVEVGTSSAPFSNTQYQKQFDKLSHGSHILKMFVTANVGGAELSSNVLVFALSCVENGNNTTIVSCNFSETQAQQGDMLTFNYSVYNPLSLTSNVQLKVNEEVIKELTVDRTIHTWHCREYPAGNVVFSIVSNGQQFTANVNVSEFIPPVQATTTGLELFLTSANRSNYEHNPDTLVYGDITTDFHDFNHSTNGWIDDVNGDTALRCNNTAQAVINYMPFASDRKERGKAIEIEFAVRDVLDYDVPLISCYDENNNVGFKIYANYIVFRSQQSSLTSYFKEEEKIRVSIIIEDAAQDRKLSVYVNGVHSGCQIYPASDNFRQPEPQPITVGSGSVLCGIDFYILRVYDNDLTRFDILNNFIADRTSTSEINDLYEANDIYDEYGNIIYSKVLKHIPCATLTGPMSTSKQDTKSGTPFELESNIEDIIPFKSGNTDGTDNTQNVVQGTSSAVLPTKNLKIKLKSGVILTKTGEWNSKYEIYPNAIPESTFCLKANHMESSNSHNTTMATKIIPMFMPKIPQQLVDSRIKSAVYGFPMILFNRETDHSVRQYVGIFDFNNDKSNSDTFGCGGLWPNAQIIEFCNNTSPACLFKSTSFSDEDFEMRYPDVDNPDFSIFKETYLKFVVDNNISAYTDELLPEPVIIKGHTYIYDSKDYRIAKFRNEAPHHLDVDAHLAYYLLTDVFLMTDSWGKNFFPGTSNALADEPIWTIYPYDMDTILYINNEGVDRFPYDIEPHDTVGTSTAYNAEPSVLWRNIELAYPDEIKELYKQWRSRSIDKLSFENIFNIFNDFTYKKVPEALYNEDAEAKYIKPYKEGKGNYLSSLQGNRISHLKYWLFNRIRYVDGKYGAGDYMSNYITLRLYTPNGEDLVVQPNFDFDIASYMSGYIKASYGGKIVDIRQREVNTVTHITAPSTIIDEETGEEIEAHYNDTECFIYGYGITDIGDLAPKYPGTLNVALATSLKTLKIGDETEGYSNENLTEVTLGNNTLLTHLNVANCPNLSGSIDVSGCTNIEEIILTGTAVTGVELPVGGNLKRYNLPATVSSLTIINHNSITEFSCQGYDNLHTLRLEGFPLDVGEIVRQSTALTTVRLINVNITDTDLTVLERLKNCRGLDENGKEIDYPVITGIYHVNGTITMSDKVMYEDIYAGLTVTAETIIDDVLYDKDGNVVIDNENNVIVLPHNTAYTVDYSNQDLDKFIVDVEQAIQDLENNRPDEETEESLDG